MPSAVLVPGEEELGPQRCCPRCRFTWPLDDEFWQRTVKRGKATFHAWCKACLHEVAAERRAGVTRGR